jgi:ASC-1-like (ASCH) protein
MGFADRTERVGDIMREYYSDEDVRKYGALAIRIMIEPA